MEILIGIDKQDNEAVGCLGNKHFFFWNLLLICWRARNFAEMPLETLLSPRILIYR